jgi:hypothetical protein
MMRLRSSALQGWPRWWASVIAIATVCLAVLPRVLRASDKSVPFVPAGLEVPAGHKLFLVGHAVGTQNFLCQRSPEGEIAWAAVGPQATLFNVRDGQVITHFLSLNPEDGVARATWQHSRDTSAAWAKMIETSSDPDFVAAGAIPWLLLEKVGTAPGPKGGDRLTETTHIQRINTTGGRTPETGCADDADLTKREFVAYTADYYFYRADRRR